MASYDDIVAGLNKISNNRDLAMPRAPGLRRTSKTTDFERAPSGIFKGLDWLNRGQYAVLNPLRRITDDRPDTAGDVLKSVWDGLRGKERSQTTDVLDNLGWRPETKKGKLLRGAVGLAGDILLDPTTYIPLGQLTKVGKLAKAGKLVKYGERVFDITNKAHANELLEIASKGLQAAGKKADEIGKAGKLFTGIFRKGAADDIVKLLNGLGGKGEKVTAEVVKLAPNWAKQVKAGQRALLQFELPRILGGASARIPVLGEQKLANAASHLNRIIGAGRILTDRGVLAALPKADLATRSAARKGNLIKAGDELIDVTKEMPRALAAVGKRLIEQGKNVDTAKLASEIGTFTGKGNAKKFLDKVANYGLGFAEQGIEGLTTKTAAERIVKNRRWALPLGRTVNAVSSALNLIPAGVKTIRRLAEGSSGLAGEIAGKEVQKALGKDGFELLTKGIKDLSTEAGQLELVRRIELLEGIGDLGTRREWNRLARSAGGMDINKAQKALDALSTKNKATQEFLQKLGRRYGVETKKVLGGLDANTVERMKDTLESWNDIDAISRLSDALKKSERSLINMGSLSRQASLNRSLTERLGYVPRRLNLLPGEQLSHAAASVGAEPARVASRNRTFYESWVGERSRAANEYLAKNYDRVITHDAKGKPIRGKDVLDTRAWKTVGDFREANAKREKLGYELALAREKRAKAVKAAETATAAVKDKINNEIARWDATIKLGRQSLGDVTARYDKALDALQEAAGKVRELKFSPELAEELMGTLRAGQNKMKLRTIVSGVLGYGEKLEPGKAIPYGMVRASDIFSDKALRQVLNASEASGEYKALLEVLDNKQLREALNNTVVPYQYLRPIKEMIQAGQEPSGAVLKVFDAVQNFLKPFMLSRPSTQVRNTISSIGMAVAAGDFANPAQGLENFSKVIGFLASGKGDVMINGTRYSLQDLWQTFSKFGGHEGEQVIQEMVKPLTDLYGGGRFDRGFDKFSRGTKKLARGSTFLTQKWAEGTENAFRFSHFINELQKGSSVEDAIESVALHFYDYGDLSRFEKSVSRRIMPFYTFFRKNMEANIRYFLTNHGYLKTPMALASNINQVTAGDKGAINLSALGSDRYKWLADQGAFRLPWDGSRLATMEGFLPQTDFAKLNPLATIDKITESVSPIYKIPMALYNNLDSFRNRPISTPEHPRVPYLGMSVRPGVAHALTPLGVLSTADKIAKAAFPERYRSLGGYVPDDDLKMAPGRRLRRAALGELAFRSTPLDAGTVTTEMIDSLNATIKKIDKQLAKKPAPGYKKALLEQRAYYQDELNRLGGGK